jgi:energy-coupling factor transporter ATP-binding protein EcfA2
MIDFSVGDADNKQKIVIILGPTASGKSDLAVRLAERLDGEIVNSDSMQLYRGLDIGTAKPSPELRQRVPHHLIDIADPTGVLCVRSGGAAKAVADAGRGKGLLSSVDRPLHGRCCRVDSPAERKVRLELEKGK